MKKLIEFVSKLKDLLGEHGEYSISRTDKKPMDFTEVIMVGNVLENISIELQRHLTPAAPYGEGRCPHCGAGDDNHHSYTCPTGLHPDRRR